MFGGGGRSYELEPRVGDRVASYLIYENSDGDVAVTSDAIADFRWTRRGSPNPVMYGVAICRKLGFDSANLCVQRRWL
jgi:hypothetical protein